MKKCLTLIVLVLVAHTINGQYKYAVSFKGVIEYTEFLAPGDFNQHYFEIYAEGSNRILLIIPDSKIFNLQETFVFNSGFPVSYINIRVTAPFADTCIDLYLANLSANDCLESNRFNSSCLNINWDYFSFSEIPNFAEHNSYNRNDSTLGICKSISLSGFETNCPVISPFALEASIGDPTFADPYELAPFRIDWPRVTRNLQSIPGLNPGDILYIRARYSEDSNETDPLYYSDFLTYDIIGCSPVLDEITYTKATCFNAIDADVTLKFKNNITPNSDMRYYIYEGDPSSFTGNKLANEQPDDIPGIQAVDDPILKLNSNLEGTYSGLGAGTYFLIYQELDYSTTPVTVKSGELTESFTIEEPSEVTVSIDAFTQPQCIGETGEVTLTASGGQDFESGDYEFSNNGGTTWQSNPTFSNLAQDQTYTFSAQLVLADGECVSTNTARLTIDRVSTSISINSGSGWLQQPSSPTATDGSLRIITNGGVVNYTYVLFDDANRKLNEIIGSPNATEDFTGLAAGHYYVTVTDGNGCSATSQIILLEAAPLPKLGTPAVTEISCTGETNGLVAISITAGTAPYNYQWKRDGSVISSGSTSNATLDFNALGPGEYELIVASAGVDIDINPAATISSGTIQLTDPLPVVIQNVAATAISCNGAQDGSIGITATGGTSYEYKLGFFGTWTTLSNDSIPITVGGFYDVYLRNQNGCESAPTAGIFVAEPDEILVSEVLSNHQDVSSNGGNDGAIVIDVSGGTPGTTPNEYSFEWTAILDNGTTFIPVNTQNLQNLFAGNYTVEVTDSNLCKQTFDPVPISEPGPLSIQSLTGTNTCNGLETGALTATVQGTGNIKFDFLEQASGTIAYSITTANRTVTSTNLAAGTYALRITEVSSGNTVTTPAANYLTIAELAPIAATVTPTDIPCNQINTGAITITDATGGSNAGFEYAIDDGFGFQTGNAFTNLPPRTYLVTVRDDLGCEYSTTVEVQQAGPPIVNELTSLVTNTSSAISLDGAIVLEFETDPTNYTYEWTGPGITGRNTTKDLDGLAAATYKVIITAPGNCTLTREFIVGVQPAFSIQSFTGTPTCFNQANGSLTATIVATGPVTFNWRLEDGSLVATETTNERTAGTEGRAAGNYYVELVDANDQRVQSDLFEIVELAGVSAVINPVPTCLGDATGSIRFSGATGSPSGTYSYSIDNGLTFQASPLFEGLAADSYTPRVRAFENPNCDYSAPGVVIPNSPGIFWDESSSLTTRASGPGATDGAIAPVFTGGTAPLTFLWSANANNATSQNVNGLGAGSYSVTVTDAANCSLTQDFEVTEVGPLTITNIIPTNATCKGSANGSITTSVTGEGTITFVWTLSNGAPVPVSNGVNGANLSGILAGNYILTATDDNATVTSASIAIAEPTAAVTVTTITHTNVSCFGGNDGQLEIVATGGSGTYTYSLNGGAFQASPITGLLANSYSVRVRDANACEYTEPTAVLILEPEELNLIINEQRPVTAANATDGAIFITTDGGSGDYTYDWTGPNGYTSTEQDILNLDAGDYIVTITDTNFALNNGAGCRLISSAITIAEPGVLLASLDQTVLLECSGDDFAEITATVQGGVLPYNYQWFQVSNGSNTLLNEDTNIIGNLTAGNYFLRVSDANSVSSDTNPIPINEPTQLQITVDNTVNVICRGQSTGRIDITVSGGTAPYQYFWSNSATVSDISGLDAGEYTVEVQDAAGCIAEDTITITTPDDVVQITNVTKNNASAYEALDGSISVDISGGAAPYNYSWTRLSDNSNIGNQATISNLQADSYSVSVSDANGCTITETYEVTQPDIIEETIIQPSCSGYSNGSITVLANKGNGTFTYEWNTGAATNTISDLGSGSYTVTISGFEDGPLTRTYVLDNPAPLEVNLGADSVLCADQVLELDATVNDESATYAWSSDNGFNSALPFVVLTETGNYTVTVQSENGCTAQGTIFVDVSTAEINAEFAISSQVFVGETVVAVDISYPLPEGMEWIIPLGAKVITQNKDAAEFSFAEAGEYEITIITTRGECIAQKTKKILVVAKDGLIQEEEGKSAQKIVEEFIVYPNPTSGLFTADINLSERGDVSIKVFGFANNALMASQKARGETAYSLPFDISGMPTGVYAVLLETPYGTSLRKIVVR